MRQDLVKDCKASLIKTNGLNRGFLFGFDFGHLPLYRQQASATSQ